MRVAFLPVLALLLLVGLTLAAPLGDGGESSPSPLTPEPLGPSTGPSGPATPAITVPVISCPPSPGGCPGCQELAGAPTANIILEKDDAAHNITLTLYYENLTASPPRKLMNFTTVIVHVYNESFSDAYRIYTDSEGRAVFDFSSYADRCVKFKFMYCPFTCADSSQCGLQQCLNASGIGCPPCNVSAIPWYNDREPPTALECYKAIPAIGESNYCPPPKPLNATPEICFPLILIFALLAGALFLSGRNPFSGFDFSAPRVGRHMASYQPRARGVSIDTLSVAKQLYGGIMKEKKIAADKKAAAERETLRGKGGEGKATGVPGVTGQLGAKGPVTGGAPTAEQRAAAADQIKAEVKASPWKAGVLGILGAIGVGLFTSSFIGQVLSPLLRSAFTKSQMETIKDRNQTLKEYVEKKVKDGLDKNAVFYLPDGTKVEIVSVKGETLNRNPTDASGNPLPSKPLEVILIVTTPDGKTLGVEFTEGKVLATDQRGIKYDITNGAFQPVSMIMGGKEVKIESAGEGLYRFKTDDGSFFMSVEKGTPIIRDVNTGETVASPKDKFSGFDPTIAFENRLKPAPFSLNDTERVAAEISKFAYQEMQADLPGLGEVTITKRNLANIDEKQFTQAEREAAPSIVVRVNSTGTTLEIDNQNIIFGAMDSNGHAIESGKIPGTKLSLGDEFVGPSVGYKSYLGTKSSMEQYDDAYQKIVMDSIQKAPEKSGAQMDYLKGAFNRGPSHDPLQADADAALLAYARKGATRKGDSLHYAFLEGAKPQPDPQKIKKLLEKHASDR